MSSMKMQPKWQSFLLATVKTQKCQQRLVSIYSTRSPNQAPQQLHEICKVVSSTIGGLDDLQVSLNRFKLPLTSSHITQVIDFCKHEAPTRRLLRFFLWSCKNSNISLQDKDYNYAARAFAEMKDYTAINILISNLRKEGRVMETQTFSVLAEALVKLGREDDALGIFKNLHKFKCAQDSVTVAAIVNALCSRGHAKRAAGVVYHHKDKISGVELCIYKSLIHGWCIQENVKEARKVIKDMKLAGVLPDLFCYNTFLRGLCERNLKRNPSGLVPEALNVMMEMRSYKISPTSISYNILLSCLGRTRRVKESCQVFHLMKKSDCAPDWVTYYLVTRLLYLTGRFGKGNKMVDEMIKERLIPDRKFYYDLIGILCGVERMNFALDLFERMKISLLGGYGPVYDVLIPKLCRGGDFEKGKELWDEARAKGITLNCSRDVLDPSITEVFKPTRKVSEVYHDHTTPKTEAQLKKPGRDVNKTKRSKKKKKNKKNSAAP
ncbi:hypothetical protein Ddye_027665 [Dipteronia dyeriana]|uniref:Pentatricopeptide repeat-containing protein n=1 Tax=Dipteronia dyeriana TaxID=168575 RepID=A0AAD9WRN0_9ROSI|nr:hypothetical protein Ddye_027665 [Dipteronia dyeriana]